MNDVTERLGVCLTRVGLENLTNDTVEALGLGLSLVEVFTEDPEEESHGVAEHVIVLHQQCQRGVVVLVAVEHRHLEQTAVTLVLEYHLEEELENLVSVLWSIDGGQHWRLSKPVLHLERFTEVRRAFQLEEQLLYHVHLALPGQVVDDVLLRVGVVRVGDLLRDTLPLVQELRLGDEDAVRIVETRGVRRLLQAAAEPVLGEDVGRLVRGPEGHLPEESGGEGLAALVVAVHIVQRVHLDAGPPAGLVLAAGQLLRAAALDARVVGAVG